MIRTRLYRVVACPFGKVDCPDGSMPHTAGCAYEPSTCPARRSLKHAEISRFCVRRWRGPSVLSVIDPPASASRQPPAPRMSLLGSSCQCAMRPQDAGVASDRVSAGTVLALLEHRNALSQVAARKGSPLPSLPVIGRDVRFRSGLVTSALAALGAISLGEACRGAAGWTSQRPQSANHLPALSRTHSGIAYRVYRHYWPHRNGG